MSDEGIHTARCSRFTGALAVAVIAVAVASCGGGGGTKSTPEPTPSIKPSAGASSSPSTSPSSGASSSPSTSPSSGPSSSPSTSPSSSGGGSLPDYGFHGPSDSTGSFTPPMAPVPLFVPSSGTYGTYDVTSTVSFDSAGGYASSPASTTSNITLTYGSSSADITSSSFPYYSGSAHPLFYAEIVNTGAVHFTDFPDVVVTSAAAALPSTSCSFYTYSNDGSNTPSWNAIAGPVTATGSSGSYTIHFPAQALSNGTVDLVSGSPNYIFVGC